MAILLGKKLIRNSFEINERQNLFNFEIRFSSRDSMLQNYFYLLTIQNVFSNPTLEIGWVFKLVFKVKLRAVILRIEAHSYGSTYHVYTIIIFCHLFHSHSPSFLVFSKRGKIHEKFYIFVKFQSIGQNQ